MITREFLDSLKVMDVMEDWGKEFGGKSTIAAKVVQKLREVDNKEIPILVEALHIMFPDSIFAYECDNLMIMTTDVKKLPMTVQHAASLIEEVSDGQLKVVKIRNPEHEGTLRKWLREVISSHTSQPPCCD